ncbi:MAG: flavodoxin domain-containing protein [Candidatus Eremiobacteraeota bacterium]|nr:flavodoxin domain-containing protein [Candidatus Eremiobacteraeota bacterium]
MPRNVSILVGTMTGTAELVASEVQAALEGAGHQATVTLMDDLTPATFEDDAVFLICTSTYGNGDVPDNAQALFAALETSRPDLSNVRFGLIALGDRTYKATFCQGGLRFDALLRELGAKRIGDALLHDAGAGTLPEDVAAAWSVEWARELSAPEVAA